MQIVSQISPKRVLFWDCNNKASHSSWLMKEKSQFDTFLKDTKKNWLALVGMVWLSAWDSLFGVQFEPMTIPDLYDQFKAYDKESYSNSSGYEVPLYHSDIETIIHHLRIYEISYNNK